MHRLNQNGHDDVLAMAMDAAEAGVWDWELGKEKVEWSPRLAKLCGVEPGVANGSYKSLLACVHPDDRRAVARRLDEAWNKCDGFEQEFRTRWPDGSVRWLFSKGKFICGEDHKPARMIGTVVDITPQKIAEDEARTQQAEIAHLARLGAVGQMATGMAHELTQPLTAILNFATSAMNLIQSDDPASREAAIGDLREVIRETHRASELVARMRSFGKKEAPKRVPIDLNLAAKEAIDLLRYRLRHHGVRVDMRLQRGLAPVSGDPLEIQQVFVNLLQNAIDSMRDSEGPARLTVRTSTGDDQRVLVRITDTGAGVKAENLDELFRAFYTTKSEGLGLGLSISKTIIEQHGGTIRARRNGDRGMVFEFELPVAVNGARHQE
jgi:PAS domain S-box-containing protein